MNTTYTAIEAAELAYLRELAADIAAHGGLSGATMAEAIAAAHDRRQVFTAEMAQGETTRARMAHAALAASIWAEIHANHAPGVARREWIDSGAGR